MIIHEFPFHNELAFRSSPSYLLQTTSDRLCDVAIVYNQLKCVPKCAFLAQAISPAKP